MFNSLLMENVLNLPGSSLPGHCKCPPSFPKPQGLALGVLLLSAAATMPGCPNSTSHLLLQIQNLLNATAASDTLLEPYLRNQGLDTPILRGLCMECDGGAFPSEGALRVLSKPHFLRTVYATLGRILHGLDALQLQISQTEDTDTPKLQPAKWKVLGLRNNIHCLAWLLNSSLQTPEPTRAVQGTQPSWSPTPSQPIFQGKVDGCKFLCGYHGFMQAVGKVFRDWGDRRGRSRRHSPHRGLLHKGVHRVRRASRPGSRSGLPR
ncbi:oncostatin-M [Thomomys bottae]